MASAASPSHAAGSAEAKHYASTGQVVPVSEFRLTLADLDGMNQDQMKDENLKALNARGGVIEIARQLNVDVKVGLTSEEARTGFEARGTAFGWNKYPEPPMKGFWKLWLESFNDLTLMILIVAAFVSLGVGAYEDPEKGWIDGIAILIAVLLVAFVTAGNDYSKENQFRALNAVKDSIDVKVLRDGKQELINTNDLIVGEVLMLDTGDKIPADCVFIRGDDVESNESSLTGEPEDLRKNADKDPFLLSGCQITAGACRALVIAVGNNSRWGRIKARLATEAEDTPLQEKLDDMAAKIGWVGAAAALATMVAMIVLWFADPDNVQTQATSFVNWLIHAFIVGVTIIVVAIPEGLPLAVTISLAYSTKKMLKDKNLIRVLAACETMGNATNICSDKTGTLTENRMTVVEAWFAGKHYKEEAGGVPEAHLLPSDLTKMLIEGVSVNSNAELRINKDDLKLPKSEQRREVTGSKTEGALLMMIEKWDADYSQIRNAAQVKKQYMFSSARKMMSVLVAREDGTHRLYVKGASEIVMARCIKAITGDGTVDLGDAIKDAGTGIILHMAQHALRTIGIAHRDFGPGELPADWNTVPPETDLTWDGLVGIQDPLRPDVAAAVKTCQGAGIMVRMVTGDNIETAKAIARKCGILTAHGEALEGPSFREMTPAALDAVIPRLQVLARSSPDDKHTLVVRLNGKKIPKTQAEWQDMHPGMDFETNKDTVLPGFIDEWKAARTGQAADGEVVGVTGDGTNDAPALKAADVGLSMGLSGTEVAKEASDIVIMDDKFSSIVKAVLWGRSVYDNIRKFLQFQLTVNVVALCITFLAAVLSRDPPLNPVMMLWVNLIMDTMGALALGTEPPTMQLLDRKPYRRNAMLVSHVMWRNILVQSLYQLILLLLLLLFGGTRLVNSPGNVEGDFYVRPAANADEIGWFGADVKDGVSGPCFDNQPVSDTDWKCQDKDYRHFTIIFNAFVWCQIFNEFNARRINDDWNVFKGVHKNALFLGVIVVSIALQVFIVEVGGDFTKTSGLTGEQWLISIALGFVSLPLGVVMRFIPMTEDPKSFGGYDDPNTAGSHSGADNTVHVISAEEKGSA